MTNKIMLVSVFDYAKIKQVSHQAIYDRMKRGSVKWRFHPKMVRMVEIDANDIPKDFQGRAVDPDIDLSKVRQ